MQTKFTDSKEEVETFGNFLLKMLWKAIKTAFERGELPTRALALSSEIRKKPGEKLEKQTMILRGGEPKRRILKQYLKRLD